MFIFVHTACTRTATNVGRIAFTIRSSGDTNSVPRARLNRQYTSVRDSMPPDAEYERNTAAISWFNAQDHVTEQDNTHNIGQK